MTDGYTRRGAIAAALAAGVAGLSLSDARDLMETFAPLSGRAWDAADRSLSEAIESPYGAAEVRFDDDGVPHVAADDEAAAYFAVGYVQGFDRLFQLDLQRRVMRGRVSEVVGEAALDSDEFHVRMDFAGAAEATWERLEGTETGAVVEAYADGVNAAIENERLPVEFELLGYAPREWTSVDSMLMEKQISWTLTGSFRELTRARVADQLGDDLASVLYPDRLDHESPILREGSDVSSRDSDVSSREEVDARLEGVGQSNTESEAIGADLVDWLREFESPPGIGSNSWVVSGERTSTGRPIVANDPHLSLMTPPVWYEQAIDLPEATVRGVTFPGVPFVVIGANERGAWGFTNVGADVLDCYRYEIEDGGDRYRYRGEWREFDVEEREVPVADGEDRTITVRKTVHGPVVEREGRTVGVAWTGLTATRTTEAIREYAFSEGVDDVLEATRTFDSPTQNLVYADRDGRTLYYATGKYPIRRIDGEVVGGNRLFDGSAGEGEWEGFTPYGESSWDGFVPFEEQPHAIDADYVATANQRVVDDPAHYVGVGFASPFRGARIYDVLDGRADDDEPMDPAFHRDLQRDVLDRRAHALVPDLLDALRNDESVALEGAEDEADEPSDDGDPIARAARALETWDRRMDRDSESALVFDRWLSRYRELAFDPVFEGTDLDASYYPNDWVLATLPDDDRFFGERSRAAAMVAALRNAIDEIDDEGWDVYGDRNRTGSIRHPFGGQAAFLNYGDDPIDGSGATVANYRVESAVGSSWRMVVEPGGESTAILPGGNSGDYFSSHYDDQFDRWRNGEYKSMDAEPDAEVTISFTGGSE